MNSAQRFSVRDRIFIDDRRLEVREAEDLREDAALSAPMPMPQADAQAAAISTESLTRRLPSPGITAALRCAGSCSDLFEIGDASSRGSSNHASLSCSSMAWCCFSACFPREVAEAGVPCRDGIWDSLPDWIFAVIGGPESSFSMLMVILLCFSSFSRSSRLDVCLRKTR